MKEVKRPHFFDCDVLYVLSDSARNYAKCKFIVSSYLLCTQYSSKSLRIFISSVALYVDCRRVTGNLGHLWSKRLQLGAVVLS